MSNRTAHLVEMFSSIQGEGIFVGVRQAFLRFHGCTLACAYCDSGGTLAASPPDSCRIEERPGTGEFAFIKNPVSLEEARGAVEGWLRGNPSSHHSISITGGEPLLHYQVLRDWLPSLKDLLPVFLETNGTGHQELNEIIDLVDFVSMDVKLPSTSGLEGLWDEHLAFMRVASRSNLYVKLVIGDSSTPDEIEKTCEIIRDVDRSVPLVLQPLTSSDGRIALSSRKLLELQEVASKRLKRVRVIPQTHLYMGLP